MKTPATTDPDAGFLPPRDAEVRATAWALDQLEPADRAAFEKEMAADPALAEYAREMRVFCGEVSLELPAECDQSQLRLQESRRAPLVAALSQAEPENLRRGNFASRHWRGLSLFSAAAAAACVTLVMRPAWLPDSSSVRNQERGPGGVSAEAPPSGESVRTVAASAGDSRLILASSPEAPPVAIRPAMPLALFTGTPLPQMVLPPNFDRSQRPVFEVQVPAGTVLLSKNCPVTSSDPDPIGELSLITDGDKQGDDGYFVDLAPGKVWVAIDLGKSAEINLLWVWHFHKQGVIFKDVVAQVSDDPGFKTFTTVFNNDYDNSLGFGVGQDLSYQETNYGRAMPVKGARGRYVRLHSNGRDLDDTNQYIEVEVYGRPLDAAAPAALLADASPEKAPEGESKLAELPAGLAKLSDAADGAQPADAKSKSVADQLASNTSIRPLMSQATFPGTPLPLGAAPMPVVQASNEYALMPAKGAGKDVLAENLASVEAVRGLSDGARGGRAEERETLSRSERAKQDVALRYRNALPALTPLSAAVPDNNWREAAGTESYQNLPRNPFLEVTQAPLSTFSIDVDTASYSNVRRFLNAGSRPPAEAVRLEELVNYFPYDEAGPVDGKPFGVRVDVTSSPWDAKHRLARVVLKGKEVAAAERPASNLVFLVDVSGSMNEPNKLPLVQQSLRLLTERLTENDRVSIVTYAGSSQLVQPSTNGQNKVQILSAIDSLSSGGSTNGAGGIAMAYEQASANFIKDGVNRVILATDGDFNVGATSHEELLKLITEKAKSGVFLSVLGYGMGNLKDDTMELLSDKGNGNYAYIDSLSEARKSLVEQMSGTLVTIAKDVKIQIEFNPSVVKSYKLLGYENRLLAKEDFNNDKKDAGEIGAGHTVTAMYEIVPAGQPDTPVRTEVDGLKYQQTPAVITPRPEPTPAAASGEMMTVKLRWKQPQADTSELLEIPVKDSGASLEQASGETRWAVAVAGFAQLLRGAAPGVSSEMSWDKVRELARSSKGADPFGYRGEFLQLIDKAESLSQVR